MILHEVVNDKDGNIITISDAFNNKINGIDIKYFCRGCGSEMVAKLGDINKHHFAHKSLVDCDYHPETELHYRTKHRVASLDLNVATALLSVHFGKKITCKCLEVEKRITNGDVYCIAGVRATTDEGYYAIEVVNTHSSEKKKLDNFNVIEKDVNEWNELLSNPLQYIKTLHEKNKSLKHAKGIYSFNSAFKYIELSMEPTYKQVYTCIKLMKKSGLTVNEVSDLLMSIIIGYDRQYIEYTYNNIDTPSYSLSDIHKRVIASIIGSRKEMHFIAHLINKINSEPTRGITKGSISTLLSLLSYSRKKYQ